MLKRLSLRFSAAAVSALFVIELIMILMINGLNFYYSVRQTDETLSALLEGDGSFANSRDDFRPDSKPDRAPDDGNGLWRFGDERADKEMRYMTRYFTAAINTEGSVVTLDTGHIASVSSDEAERYALDVLAGNKQKGFYDGMAFRWAMRKYADGSKLAVFCDFTVPMQDLRRVAFLSAEISAGLLVVFSMMIILVSRRVVRPVIENSEKQAQFITDAGHELKTPLAIIRANTEVIEMTSGETEWTRSTIHQTDRLSDLLGRMLMLAKSRESQRFSFEDVDLSALAKDTAGHFETYCTAENKPLKADIAEGVHVSGDPKMLDMLMSSLLENAVKYGITGEQTVFALTVSSKHARITVENLCEDPPQGDLSRLFDRFYRADTSRTRETGGSGLGLSLAKTITDAHGGKITCETEGKKVRFTVRLRLA